jgi:nicotinamidase/pyrazinamidase
MNSQLQSGEGTQNRSALLIIDVQNDFCTGGSLPVPGADEIVPLINEAIEHVTRAGLLIYASRDWHRRSSPHFQQFGGHWPVHCVAGTYGAEFQPALQLPKTSIIVSKGQIGEGYSAFEAITEDGVTFGDELRRQGVDLLYIAGIAVDYCVRATAIDALRKGFGVTILIDAVVGINAQESARALEQMKEEGASMLTVADLGHAFRTIEACRIATVRFRPKATTLVSDPTDSK